MSPSKPLISVIIPTYNYAKFLSQAIDSVLNQSNVDFEIIIIDDGSTDQTFQVIESYDCHIKYIYQQNQGVAVARNRGLSEAQGDLIAFLDADDSFWPQKLEKQADYFCQSSELGMVICGWQLVSQSGIGITNIEPWQWFPTLNLEAVVLNKPARPSAMMIRRSWCEQVGGFDESLSSAEDLDFLLRLLLAGCESAWLPKILVNYRQHADSLMSQGYKLVEDNELVMRRFFRRSDIPKEIVVLKQRERRQSYLWLAARMYFNGYPTEMERCLKEVLKYTTEQTTQSGFEWFQFFRNYSIEYGHQFDAYELTNSSGWKTVIQSLLPRSLAVAPKSERKKQTNRFSTQKQPRILLYSDDPGAGGILQCNHAIASHLAQTGYHVSHLHYVQDTPLNQREQELGITQIDLGYHAGVDITRSQKDLEGSKQHFLNTQPDLIIFSDGWPFSNLAAKQAAIDLNIPYIIVLGFIEPSCEKYDYQDDVSYRDLVALQYAHAQSVITVSQENLSLLRKIFELPESIGKTIYNGRPDSFFTQPDQKIREKLRTELKIPLDAVVCFTSGRLEAIKGHQYQIEAIKLLLSSPVWKKLYFIWVGVGIEHLPQSNELELKQAIEELKISDRVKFLGHRWDMPDLLDTSDIFILSSEAEGMPLSVMEAMAKGLPVIASAVSGIPEELGETGQLLPNPLQNPQGAIALLANTIERWATSEELRQSVGNACRQRAEKLFREGKMVQQYEEIVAQCFEAKTVNSENKKDVALRLKRLSQQQKSDIQRQFEYSGWVWQGWYQYQQKNDDLMKVALQQALTLKPIKLGVPIIKWGKMFARFSQEKGQELDSYDLTRSKAWKSTIYNLHFASHEMM